MPKVSIQLPTPTAQQTAVPTAKPVDETQSIINAVYKKFNSDEEKLDVSVNKIMGDYATGNVKEKTSEVGGGYFLAAKAGGKWIVVYDGQSTPTCQQLVSYNFPSTMVPECLGEGGKLIKR